MLLNLDEITINPFCTLLMADLSDDTTPDNSSNLLSYVTQNNLINGQHNINYNVKLPTCTLMKTTYSHKQCDGHFMEAPCKQ